jgi:O-antigen ligase
MKGEYRLLLPLALLPAFSKVRIRTLLKVYVVFVCIISIYSIIQFKFGVDWLRPEGKKLITPYMNLFHGKGNFSHHLTYAGFMLMNVPFFFALLLFDRDKQRYLWATASLFSVLGVLVSLGRSCWVGTIAGLFILILILPKKISFPILGSGLILGIAFIYVASSGLIQEHIQPSNEHSVFLNRIVKTSITNDRDRLYMWEAGWLGFKDNPWIGVGIGNEDYRYEPYRKIVADKHGGHTFLNSASAGVHNLYLQILFVNGAIGLTAHFLLFAAVFIWCGKWIRYSTPNTRFETGLLWGTVGASTGILVASVFDNFFFDSEVQNLNMILFGLAIYAGLKIREQRA